MTNIHGVLYWVWETWDGGDGAHDPTTLMIYLGKNGHPQSGVNNTSDTHYTELT